MPLHVAIQMDPIEKLDIIGDTSFALGLEAQTRGHHLWYYTPDQLSYEEGQISACGQALKSVSYTHLTLPTKRIV